MKLYLASKAHILALIAAAVFGFGLGVNNLTLGGVCLIFSVVLDYMSFNAHRADARLQRVHQEGST